MHTKMIAILLLAAAAPATAMTIAGPFNAADTAAIYAAAGIKTKAGKLVGCADGNPDWPAPSMSIDAADLGGDGKMEAIVNEGSTACYGNTGNHFTVVGKDATGKWVKLGDATGMPGVLKTRHNGWLDIEIGGPGFARMPVMRWNGKAYVY